MSASVSGARKRILHGSIWLLGTQGAGFVLQFAYAAATARLVGVAEFGSYAIAIASVGIVNILSNAGIGQSVLRTDELSRREYRALASLSLCVGVFASGAVLLSAEPWSKLWGGGFEAVDPIRWLAISCFLAPFIGFTSAILRRDGMFKQIALSQLGSNFIGMVFGLLLVLEFRTASSLVGNLVITQILLVLYLAYRCQERALPGAVGKSSFPHLAFSGQVTLTNMLYYLQQNLPKLAVSRFLGTELLGYWNRAEVLTAIPFQAVQVALLQTIYPEFRRFSHDSELARKKWTSMLVWSAVFSIPLGCLLSAVVPTIVLVMYGEAWSEAGRIAALLALACSLLPTTTLLAAGLEAMAHFGAIYWSQIVCIVVELLLLVAVVSFRSALMAVISYVGSLALRHILQLISAGRLHLIDFGKLAIGYGASVLVGFLCFIAASAVLSVAAEWGFSPVGQLALLFMSILATAGPAALVAKLFSRRKYVS